MHAGVGTDVCAAASQRLVGFGRIDYDVVRTRTVDDTLLGHDVYRQVYGVRIRGRLCRLAKACQLGKLGGSLALRRPSWLNDPGGRPLAPGRGTQGSEPARQAAPPAHVLALSPPRVRNRRLTRQWLGD